MKSIHRYVSIIALLCGYAFSSCQEADSVSALNSDPTVFIVSNYPSSGRIGRIAYIRGKNFKGWISEVRVFIGNVVASVNDVDSTTISFVVPKNIDSGKIKITYHDITRVSPGYFYCQQSSGPAIFAASKTIVVTGDLVELYGDSLALNPTQTEIKLDSLPVQIRSIENNNITFVIPKGLKGGERLNARIGGVLVRNSIVFSLPMRDRIISSQMLAMSWNFSDTALIKIKLESQRFDSILVTVNGNTQPVIKQSYSGSDSTLSVTTLVKQSGLVSVSIKRDQQTSVAINPDTLRLPAFGPEPILYPRTVWYWHLDSVQFRGINGSNLYVIDYVKNQLRLNASCLLGSTALSLGQAVFDSSRNALTFYYRPLPYGGGGNFSMLFGGSTTIVAKEFTKALFVAGEYSRVDVDLSGLFVKRTFHKTDSENMHDTTYSYMDTVELRYSLPGSRWTSRIISGDTLNYSNDLSSGRLDDPNHNIKREWLTIIYDASRQMLSLRIYFSIDVATQNSNNGRIYGGSNQKAVSEIVVTDVPCTVLGSQIMASLSQIALRQRIKYTFSDDYYESHRRGAPTDWISTSHSCDSATLLDVADSALLTITITK